MGPKRPLREMNVSALLHSCAPRSPGKRATKRLPAWWWGAGGSHARVSRMLQAQDSFPSMHRLRKDERSVGTEKEGDSGQDTGPGGTALCPSLSWPSQEFQLF